MDEDVAMKTVKTVFSVGREMKQSTRFGHGHWSHCTSRGIWKPSYITYRAYLETQTEPMLHVRIPANQMEDMHGTGSADFT